MKKIAFPIVLVLALCVAVLSCNRDDGPTGPDPIYGHPNLNLLTPTPNTGPVGTVFTITGQSFSSVPSENIVMIGDAVAPVVGALPYALRAVVPDGAVTGAISVTVKGVTLDGNTFTVTEGSALSHSQLTLYPYPHYATALQVTSDTGGDTVIWSSSDGTVATVDQDGLVTPLKIGSATVTASIGAVPLAQCAVEVVDGPVTALQLDPTELELYRGGSASLSIATLEAEVEQTGAPVWESSDEGVATVDQDGTVTTLAVGTTTITVSVDNASATCSVTVSPDVYVAGFKTINGTYVARVWRNGAATDITDGSNNAQAYSVFVDRDDRVYVVGNEQINGIYVAMLWELEGGEVVKAAQLPSQGNEAYARSVFVNDNGISFVAGWQKNNGANEAMLWRNQVADPLPGTGLGGAFAFSVFVAGGGNVHVAGTKQGVAEIWENGVPTDLPVPGTLINSSAHSVYVDGDDVYVAGQYLTQNSPYIATVWKNGIANDLGDGTTSTHAQSIFVSDGDVYVAGYEILNGIYTAKLWKNGVASDLSSNGSDFAYVASVSVYGTDVYVAGYTTENGLDIARLWKNGVPINLGAGHATSVFVK
ncbi:MAG: Ig-like domain-containing protein [Allomuricauda sp.]